MVTPLLLPRLRERLSQSDAAPEELGDVPRAAVAITLLSRGETVDVLFIRRAERVGDLWSGHMAFPGGRRDPSDRDLLATALRETREEVGLELRPHAELLGRLSDVPAYARGRPTGMMVSPFVFSLAAEPVLSINEEVVEVVWAPLAPMREGRLDTTIDYPYEGSSYRLPGYRIGERIVWGLTHRMMGLLFAEIDALSG